MFEATALLTITGAIVASIWLSLLIARLLLSAILLSMNHAAQRGVHAVATSSLSKPVVTSTASVRKSGEDSHRR